MNSSVNLRPYWEKNLSRSLISNLEHWDLKYRHYSTSVVLLEFYVYFFFLLFGHFAKKKKALEGVPQTIFEKWHAHDLKFYSYLKVFKWTLGQCSLKFSYWCMIFPSWLVNFSQAYWENKVRNTYEIGKILKCVVLFWFSVVSAWNLVLFFINQAMIQQKSQLLI